MFVMRIATVVALLLGSLAQPLMGSDCAEDMTVSGSSHALHAGHAGLPGHGHAPGIAPAHNHAPTHDHGHTSGREHDGDHGHVGGYETVEGPSSNDACSAMTDGTHGRAHHAPADCVHAPCSASLVGASLGSAGSPMGSHEAPAHAFARSVWIDLSQDPPPPRLPS